MRLVLRQKLDCGRDADGVVVGGNGALDVDGRKRSGGESNRRAAAAAGAMLQLLPPGPGAAGAAAAAAEGHRARAQSRGRQARASEDRSIMVTLVRTRTSSYVRVPYRYGSRVQDSTDLTCSCTRRE